MDRAILEQHVRRAEAFVAEGKEHLRRQRGIVADLEDNGHDATVPRELLHTMEQTQALHVADVERL
jgi:hypothetical protein